MLPFKIVYSDAYYLPFGEHVFPSNKYIEVHSRLLEEGIAGPEDFVAPQPATEDDVLLVHTPMYVNKLNTGTLSASVWAAAFSRPAAKLHLLRHTLLAASFAFIAML